MRFKDGICLALVSATIFSITSCFTMGKRAPSSNAQVPDVRGLLIDRFSQDGYDHATKRIFNSGLSTGTQPGGNQIPNQQMVQELAGRAIWFKSAPNERHHTYVFPQKIGVAIDWVQAFMARFHDSRFQTWGVINDPDCCVPGVSCDQKKMFFNQRSVTLADTFGWEYCAGDETLLNSISTGQAKSYRDPACDDVIVKAADSVSPANEIRENRCQLKFGTSTGAVGFRKFPNPEFNAKRWQKIGGYQGYSEQMIREGANNSIQPPFRVATACASCHAAFDPLNPPKDWNNPSWSNIKGETGNQYINISKLMANGMHESTIETQLFTHTRPGTVDTSAVPHDFINNPGTINAIINLPQRPTFKETVLRWNKVDSCNEVQSKTCQKISYFDEQGRLQGYKYWQWQKVEMQVPHLLKGGEDSAGYDLAVQRVFANIGMCSEQCWQNNLTNLRELDFTSRGYGERAFDIGQCREQCSAFRANEDRVSDIISYLASRRPTDLKEALKSVQTENGEVALQDSSSQALVDARFIDFIEKKYGQGSVDRGRKIFVKSCASCHSSQNENSKENLTPTEAFSEAINFNAKIQLESGEEIRKDWLGNDKSTSVGEIGTYSCRALHSNHKRGQVWEQFSSETHKSLPSVAFDTFENKIQGGPGYYRNISLLSVWAHAPFMHNNAIGPEICGKVENKSQVVRTSVEGRQTDTKGKYVCDNYFDPSVMGRLELFDKSMDELLTPAEKRRKKITKLDVAIRFPLGIRDMFIEFPAGLPLNAIANFDLKAFVFDFSVSHSILENQGDKDFKKYWFGKLNGNSQKATELGQAVRSLIESLRSVQKIVQVTHEIKAKKLTMIKTISKYYRTCETGNDVENKGHIIGTSLDLADKNAIKAFLMTL